MHYYNALALLTFEFPTLLRHRVKRRTEESPKKSEEFRKSEFRDFVLEIMF